MYLCSCISFSRNIHKGSQQSQLDHLDNGQPYMGGWSDEDSPNRPKKRMKVTS